MRSRVFTLAGLLASVLPVAAQAQEQLGHKTLGTLGLDAGTQPPPGIYVADRLLFYAADRLYDRNGDRIPADVELEALANAVGFSGVFLLPWRNTHLAVAAGIPFTHLSVETDRPEGSLDRFGLGDLYVQPLRLGWRLRWCDLAGSYAFYAPTGRYEPRSLGGVGQGQWTQELSAGGTLYFDRARGLRLSALASVATHSQKRGVDITRGDTVQIQGGAGATLFRFLDLGLAGYALWQVSDDRGSDVPPALRGARDRVFGLGPELGALLPPLRGRLTLRYTRDLAVQARPLGQLLMASLTMALWRPAER